ncbi:Hypothetical Protein FCC1311_034112 [Hondaea fermentalgiana]|uniref:Uncharacterized protein n=1 Tax=Hondaea fermentalgiana TaxID=2315210 RepID=A0A2R5GBV5_9STRA|nr:Hypothetical Protein FCC1311_034112 [Hondaea fermentalgiana]|eukprot:GBG27188.1 Hypothetical Protein FCC1311_034112 [Hondaea fermentalgiana]
MTNRKQRKANFIVVKGRTKRKTKRIHDVMGGESADTLESAAQAALAKDPNADPEEIEIKRQILEERRAKELQSRRYSISSDRMTAADATKTSPHTNDRRHSEVWNRVKASNRRVRKVTWGHRLNDVVRDEQFKGILSNSRRRTQVLMDDFTFVEDHKVRTKAKEKIFYGAKVVLQCKSDEAYLGIDGELASQPGRFFLINLDDPTSTSPVYYGERVGLLTHNGLKALGTKLKLSSDGLRITMANADTKGESQFDAGALWQVHLYANASAKKVPSAQRILMRAQSQIRSVKERLEDQRAFTQGLRRDMKTFEARSNVHYLVHDPTCLASYTQGDVQTYYLKRLEETFAARSEAEQRASQSREIQIARAEREEASRIASLQRARTLPQLDGLERAKAIAQAHRAEALVPAIIAFRKWKQGQWTRRFQSMDMRCKAHIASREELQKPIFRANNGAGTRVFQKPHFVQEDRPHTRRRHVPLPPRICLDHVKPPAVRSSSMEDVERNEREVSADEERAEYDDPMSIERHFHVLRHTNPALFSRIPACLTRPSTPQLEECPPKSSTKRILDAQMPQSDNLSCNQTSEEEGMPQEDMVGAGVASRRRSAPSRLARCNVPSRKLESSSKSDSLRQATMLSKEAVQRLFDEHADAETGMLMLKDLYKVVQGVNLRADPQSLVLVQGAMRELYEGGDLSQGIPFELFYTWFKLEKSPGHFEKHNELLVRRVIGKVKMPTRNLKEHTFSYGQRNQADPEGAGEVVLNWVPGKLSQSQAAGVCLIKVNKAAVKNKQVTPKQVNQFLQKNKDAPSLQRPKIEGRKKDRGFKRDPNATYGVSSQSEGKREDINTIIFPQSAADADDAPYVDTSGQVRKGRLPKPRPTKSSDLLSSHTRTEREQKEAPADAWKMKKFLKNAKPRVDFPVPK